jgi:hypothetical protein
LVCVFVFVKFNKSGTQVPERGLVKEREGVVAIKKEES